MNKNYIDKLKCQNTNTKTLTKIKVKTENIKSDPKYEQKT